jgi:hypothetical protein
MTQGREVGEVEMGLVQLEGEESRPTRLAGLRPARPSSVALKAMLWGITFT